MSTTVVTKAGETLAIPTGAPHEWTDEQIAGLTEAATADIRARQKAVDAAIRNAPDVPAVLAAVETAADVVMLNVDKAAERAHKMHEAAALLDSRVALFGRPTEKICYDAVSKGAPATEIARRLRWVARKPDGSWPTNHEPAQNRASQAVRRLANRYQAQRALPAALKAIDPDAKPTPEQIEAVRAYAGSVTSPKNLTDAKLQEIAARVAETSEAPKERTTRTVYVRMLDALTSIDKWVESPKADLTPKQKAEIVNRLSALAKRFA